MEKEVKRKINPREAGFSWAKVISKNLGISERKAQARIIRNNNLPIEENEGEATIFTRFYANTLLLAQASPEFSGPRGLRPSLASAKNIFNLSNFTARQIEISFRRLKMHLGGIKNILLHDLELTASNPNSAPKGIEFSEDDVRHGIYIPAEIDMPTAQALGIVYGNGTFSNDRNLMLTSPSKNNEFYENSVRRVFENAFNFPADQKIRTVTNKGSILTRKEYATLYLSYGSKALKTYLLNHLGFPSNKDERKKSGLPSAIRNMDEKLQDEFLKYFLASAMKFNPKTGKISIYDISRPLLEDIKAMIRAKGVRATICKRPDGESSHLLLLGTIPMIELYIRGFLNENPGIKEEMKNFLTATIRPVTLSYAKKFAERLQRRKTAGGSETVVFDAKNPQRT